MSYRPLKLHATFTLSVVLLLASFAHSKEPTVSVGGVIVDEADVPVAGVAVSVLYERDIGRWQLVEATTDAAGQWNADIPARLPLLRWRLQHADFGLSSDNSPLQMTDALMAGALRHTIRRGTSRSGIVTDKDGAPLPNVVVMRGWHNIHKMETLREEIRSGTEHSAVITDEAGGFTMPIPEEERNAFAFYLEGHGPEVRDMDDVETVTLGPGATWSGVVRDADGAPLEGVRIGSNMWEHADPFLWGAIHFIETSTDADGQFSISGLPESGTVDFAIGKRSYFTQRVIWSAGGVPSDGCVYSLYLSSPLQGRVIDAVTEKPIPSFHLSYSFSRNAPAVTSHAYNRDRNVFDASGEFSVNTDVSLGDPPGAIALYVTAPNYYRTVVDPVYALDFHTPLTIMLEPGPPIRGHVVGPDGEGLHDAEVILVHPDEIALIEGYTINRRIVAVPYNTMRTLRDGRFRLMPSRGPGLLLALHASGWAIRPLAEHAPDKPLELVAWSRLEGHVSMAHRPEGDSASIRADVLMPDAWEVGRSIRFSLSGAADDAGRFTIDCVPALPLRVGESRRWMLSHAQYLTPDPDETAHVNPYGEATGAVRGVLSTAGWEDPEADKVEAWNSTRRLTITARPSDADPEDEYVNYVPLVMADGAFALEGLPMGDYELTAALHRLPPPNTCGRGAAIAQLKHPFSIADAQDGAFDLGTLRFEKIAHPQPGQAAPEIEGKSFDEQSWNLSDERGRPVLLVFWATWCAPCTAQTPLLRSLWERYGADERLQIIGLNLDWDIARAQRYLAHDALPWPHYHIGAWGETNPVTRAYGINYLPSNWLLDADGVIHAAAIPTQDLESVIEGMMARVDAASTE